MSLRDGVAYKNYFLKKNIKESQGVWDKIELYWDNSNIMKSNNLELLVETKVDENDVWVIQEFYEHVQIME